MGMYTELHLNVDLRKGVPPDVLDTLAYMLEVAEATPEVTGHPLFETPRWRHMLTCDSYYFDARSFARLQYDNICRAWNLGVQCNLKNYHDEIEHFLNWLAPYVESEGFVGYSRYEEHETPSLIFINDGVYRYAGTILDD